MAGLIEAVPNVSEGRRQEVIDAFRNAFASPPDVELLDVSSDPSHNRTVLTAFGQADALEESALRLFETSLKHIDLRRHHGQHPRIGAVDVFPFVPLEGATMEQCAALARRVAEKVADRLGVPVFLYEQAASRADRSDLALIRKGQFEGLAEKMKTSFWKPDFGPRTPHPTAGASAIGARSLLIAFNINLGTDRLDIAKTIAKRIRESNGGLPYVKALGLYLEERRQTQVSMNLTDYRRTPISVAFDAVREQATQHGTRITGSEIVGLVPEDALPPEAERSLQLIDFGEHKVLESQAREDTGKKRNL